MILWIVGVMLYHKSRTATDVWLDLILTDYCDKYQAKILGCD